MKDWPTAGGMCAPPTHNCPAFAHAAGFKITEVRVRIERSCFLRRGPFYHLPHDAGEQRMKALVPVKRVVDYNVKVRVKSDG
ncbi:hypothetical protein, partial [Aquabacterium sp.]|uniref:hypothetical protein n=1 Tax=Aquabacterium sp. TaxID=1872578 RepID=UPI002487E5D1|nr:hypothetical protein [Aquabacterium sp.]